ncbi:hypothetical protein GE21DRAFT_1221220 [Neurospora crassa]|nr:hypothetical protein GE21DRAFT_1221220 [Neurospora crassa]
MIFLFSLFWHYIYLDTLDGRGEIAVAKEKVAFSSYYLNRILLSAKIPSFGRQDGYFFVFWPIIDRYAAPSSLTALGGPMDYDLWCGSSMSPCGPTTTLEL